MFPLKETKFVLVDMILFHIINFTKQNAAETKSNNSILKSSAIMSVKK